jgi:hypothetical protein
LALIPIQFIEEACKRGLPFIKTFTAFWKLYCVSGTNRVILNYKSKFKELNAETGLSDYQIRKHIGEMVNLGCIEKSWNDQHLYFHKKQWFEILNVHAEGDMPNFALKRITFNQNDLTPEFIQTAAIALFNNKKIYAFTKDQLKQLGFIAEESEIKRISNSHLIAFKEQFIEKLKTNLQPDSKLPLIYSRELMKILGCNDKTTAIKRVSKMKHIHKTPAFADLNTTDRWVKDINRKAVSIYGQMYQQLGNHLNFGPINIAEHPFVSFYNDCIKEIRINPKVFDKQECKKAIKQVKRRQKYPAYNHRIRERIIDIETGELCGELFYNDYRFYANDRKAKKGKTKIEILWYVNNDNFSMANCIREKQQLTKISLWIPKWKTIEENIPVNIAFLKRIGWDSKHNRIKYENYPMKQSVETCLCISLDELNPIVRRSEQKSEYDIQYNIA